MYNLPGYLIFKLGQNHDGYWNNERFMKQMKVAIKIAEMKYPLSTYNHVWVFDHSSGHTAFERDAFVASWLNKKPGGKQPPMRDTIWNGMPQKLVMEDGTPKGAAMI